MKVQSSHCYNRFQVSHKPLQSILSDASCYRCEHQFTPWFNQDRHFTIFSSLNRYETRKEDRKGYT